MKLGSWDDREGSLGDWEVPDWEGKGWGQSGSASEAI